jgi:hypothetical protein
LFTVNHIVGDTFSDQLPLYIRKMLGSVVPIIGQGVAFDVD